MHRVSQSIFAIVERVTDALFQQIGNFANRFRAEVAPNSVAAHRQRQSVCVLVPPLTEIKDFAQTKILIEELTFMDQKPCVASTFGDGLDDLIERNDFVFEVWRVNVERQKSAG